MKRKNKILLLSTIIFLILIALILITYGYYLTNINGNTNDKSVTVSIAYLELTYNDGNGLISANNIMPGENITTKTFSVENTGNKKVVNYVVYLEDVINTFEDKNDLKLTLNCTSSINSNCMGNNTIYPDNDTLLVLNDIDVGEIQTYELKVDFIETYDDQSDNMNKIIEGNIVIKDLKETENSLEIVSGTDNVMLDNPKLIKNYRIYGNSIQDGTPTPDNPVEIKSVGDIFNSITKQNGGTSTFTFLQKWKDVSKIRLTAKVNTTTLGKQHILFCTYNGSWIGLDSESYKKNNWKFVNGFTNTSVSISPEDFINNEINTIEFSFNNTNDTYISNVWDRVWSQEITYYRIQFYDSSNNLMGDYYPTSLYTMYDTVSKTVITASQELGYIDYIEKYKIPFKVSGKNLFDEELLLENSKVTKVNDGYAVANYPAAFDSSSKLVKHLKSVLKPGITYTLERKLSGYDGDSVGVINISGIITVGNYRDGVDSISFTLTQEQIDSIKYVYIYGRNTETPPLFNYIQLEESEAATEYESYFSEINHIYLNEPLRKIGNYADYIDFKNKKVVRNIFEVRLTGNEDFVENGSTGTSTRYVLYDVTPPQRGDKDQKGLCTHYKVSSSNAEVGYCRVYGNAAKWLAFYQPLGQTLDEFKTFLKNEYEGGHEVTVTGIMYTPKEETIELPTIPTNEGTNIIEINANISPSKIDIEYIK